MWEAPPNELQLDAGCVHVWKAESADAREHFARFYDTLAPDERDRAARFHFESGRDGYVIARGVLRDLLSRYLRIPPASVQLAYTARGKPEIAPVHASDIAFNVAHSGELALFAFARGARVGVDVERWRANFDGQRIADRFFTEAESSRLRAAPEKDRVRAFTQQWARKESFIKAHGEGLSYPLNTFAILDDGGELRLDSSAHRGAPGGWCVRDLDPGGEYAAAVTVELASPVISSYRWEAAI